ncbi:MAG: AAA family ATPase, partial [Deltaproteobacteria bacterium]|nr:AAA family ATPase [Deltaproteobacteria bacterium]
MGGRRVIFTRKIESELLLWKNAANRKPIVLRGARQVGKTFVVNQFAKNFDHFIDINLERPKERDLFSGFNTGQELVERILLYKGQKIDTKSTLLFIDEIQHSAEAVQSLRYLYEDVKDLHVIAAGSLLEVFLKREGFSFPVGRVRNLFMYPVTFVEYLEAQNPLLAEKLLQPNVLEESSLHDLLLDAFNAYAFVGGMPEALAAYGETGSYSAVREIYDAIFMGYIEDVEKYSNLAKAKYLTHAIDRAPLYAGERITYEKFGESSFRSREMKEAFDVLERALI